MAATTDPQEAARAAMAQLTAPGGEFELAEEDVLGSRITVFANRRNSLGDVLAESTAHGDRDYIVTAGERWSFTEHASEVSSLARVLSEEYGISKGDRVAILAANCPQWIVTFWATVSLGAIAVGFNAWWSADEIAYAMGHSEPLVVVADAKRAGLIETPTVPILTVEEHIPRLASKHPHASLPSGDVAEDDPAVILYTSGTTGRPKGAVHSHRNLLAVIEYHRMNDAIAAAFGDPIPPGDKRYLLALPLFHIACLHNLAVPRLATGSAIVMHTGAFDVDQILRLIEKERVTNWGAVPTQAHRLLEHGDLSGYDLSSLKAFALASAPSSPAFKERLRNALPVAQHSLVDSYGLTESCTAAAVATPIELASNPNTLGRPIVSVQLEIRDDQGNALAEGEDGEVCVRSQFNMLGYWNDPEATANAISGDRWLRTGDIGRLEEGQLVLSSRRSDLILRGGENIYPAEIENVLAEHNAVTECIVLGTEHPDLGQEVAAVVVANPQTVTERQLTEFLQQRIAHFKVPSRWRITDERLPRNATGKVVRRDVWI